MSPAGDAMKIAQRFDEFRMDWARDYARVNKLPLEQVLQSIGAAENEPGQVRQSME